VLQGRKNTPSLLIYRRAPSTPFACLHVNALSDRQGVLDFNAQVANRAVKLGVAQQELHRADVAGFSVDERGLRPPQRMCAIGRGRIAQTSRGLSGGFCPVTLPLFHGANGLCD
jgi:hypothetical protein